MEILALQMHQNAKSRWVYEWPMKTKIKWLVRGLVARRHQRLLKGWLRHVENLNGPEEMVQVCEPKVGRNLSDAEDDMRLAEDLKDCQEDNIGIPNCQEGNEMRSLRDLTDGQEDNEGISHCQEGNEMRSKDLIDCQEGSREIPYYQEGKGEQMNSKLSSYQQMQLTEKGDQRNLLIIGGI
jgi:hypothetical protein